MVVTPSFYLCIHCLPKSLVYRGKDCMQTPMDIAFYGIISGLSMFVIRVSFAFFFRQELDAWFNAGNKSSSS